MTATARKRSKNPPRTPQQTSASARTPLTIKQRKFIDGKLKGESSAEAARKAGYSESVARKADDIIGNSPSMQGAIAAILEGSGITDELLGKRIREGLDSTILLRRTKYAAREVVVDFGERREMVELILRSKGLLTQQHQVRLSGPTLEQLLEESHG